MSVTAVEIVSIWIKLQFPVNYLSSLDWIDFEVKTDKREY